MSQNNQNLTVDTGGRQTDHPQALTTATGTGQLIDKVSWEPGDIIDGKYEIMTVIDQGSMSIVYKVKHLEWDLDLAVKTPLAGLVADEASKSRFVHKAQTWVDLGFHPNIVQCWYVRVLGGVPRVFMDYLGTGSLKSWMNADKVKPGEWAKILDLVIQACDGLGYAHDQGIKAHRNVKPENMMLTADGELLVTDFGMIKSVRRPDVKTVTTAESSQGAKRATTQTSLDFGTPEYGAPEQWDQTLDVDARADIYALGVVLFELCCGRRPFDDGSHLDPPYVHIDRHISTPAPDPREFSEDIPKALAEIILCCLAKKPEERLESMARLRKELAEIYGKVAGKSYTRPIPQAAEFKPDALNNRGVLFLDLGREKEALETWTNALKLDAYHPEAIYNKGLFEWRSFKIIDDEIVKGLEDAKRISRRAGVYLGFIHLERAAADEAEDEFIHALKDQEVAKDGIIWKYLGDARIAQQKYAKAEEAYQKALKLIPGDALSLEGQRRAQKGTRERDGEVGFAWQQYFRSFEEGHKESVSTVAIAPNGRFVISGSHDMSVRVWDLKTGARLWTLKGHEDVVTAVAVTPNGGSVVSASRDMTLRLWDVETGRGCWVARGHTDWITTIAVVPNRRCVLSGSRDKTLRLWDIETGKCLWISKEQTHGINAVAVTPNGQYALSGHDKGHLYLWDLTATPRIERRFYNSSSELLGVPCTPVSSVAISPDGQYAVVGNENSTTRLWNLESGEIQQTFKGHNENVTTLAITQDGRFVVSGSDDTTVRLWDVNTGECLWTFEGHQDGVTTVAITPGGQFIVSGSQDTTLRLWNIETGECLWTFWGYQGHTKGVSAAAAALRGRFIVSGSQDSTLRLWDLRTARCLRVFGGHDREVTTIAVTPDGRLVVSGSRDTTLRLWDLGTSECLRIFKGHQEGVNAVVITPNGRFVISGSEDTMLRLWNIETTKCLRIFNGHQGAATAVAITPKGQYIVSGSQDKTLRLWHRRTAQCLRIFKGHQGGVTTVAVTPDGEFLVSGSHDKTLRLWDIKTAKCLKIFKGHGDSVLTMVVTPDGRFLISGGQDKTLRLWEIATARCLRTFRGHRESVTTLSITPDGQFVVSGSEDRTLRLWDLDPKAQPQRAAFQVCRQQDHWKSQSSPERFRRHIAWATTAWESGKAVTAYKYLAQARSINGYERAPELLSLNATISGILPRKCLRGEWLLGRFEGHDDEVTSVTVTPDGEFAISGSEDMTLRVWDLTTTRCLHIFDEHWLSVTSVAVAPDGRFVVSGSEDRSLRLWDYKRAKCVRSYEGHEESVTTVAVTAYGRHIVSGSEDSTVRLWNPATKECFQIFKGHKKGITAVSVTPKKRFVISASKDRSLRLWDPATASCLRTFEGHQKSVTTVKVASDGRFAISGSKDSTLRMWDIASGKCLQIFRGHENWVTSVVITPDTRFSISASKDKTLRLWDNVTGKCLWIFKGHKQGVNSIAMTQDGRFIISGSDDNTVELRELDWELNTEGHAELPTEKYNLTTDVKSRNLISLITSFFKNP